VVAKRRQRLTRVVRRAFVGAALGVGATALAVFLVGHWFFVRSKRAFVDVL